MTLATAHTPLPNFTPYSDHPTEHTNTLTPPSALSWLRPATELSTASPRSTKYRTLSSIRYSITAQKAAAHLSIQGISGAPDNNGTTSAAKPGLEDSLQTSLLRDDPRLQVDGNTSDLGGKRALPNIISSAIQDMDNSHGTCFLTWIHNPSNLDYISLRLRPLCLEYPLADVATVLRWIGSDWSSSDCKALFRAVTQSWDQGKRRILAFLLIRDEDMRQKAKTKLVEYAQKSSSRTKNQLRRPSAQIQARHPQPQQQLQQERSQQLHQQQQRLLGFPGNTGNRLCDPLHNSNASDKPALVAQVETSPAFPVWRPAALHQNNSTNTNTDTITNNNATNAATIDLASVEAMAAAFMITGDNSTLDDFTSSSFSDTHNSKDSLVSREASGLRFSPYHHPQRRSIERF
ncbi:hypothetical protein EMPS_07754 [Entomortierella parvispora]|uniref:Uncharacterized protein n=1 Tax=Entomortierella parvispora TaxID=205924 RepID=A0A9P3HEQ4_9FUNG|nr:hypothetical protein EMPS_07754 [Entomortierella parvispora]